jgi:hypothetical protein
MGEFQVNDMTENGLEEKLTSIIAEYKAICVTLQKPEPTINLQIIIENFNAMRPVVQTMRQSHSESFDKTNSYKHSNPEEWFNNFECALTCKSEEFKTWLQALNLHKIGVLSQFSISPEYPSVNMTISGLTRHLKKNPSMAENTVLGIRKEDFLDWSLRPLVQSFYCKKDLPEAPDFPNVLGLAEIDFNKSYFFYRDDLTKQNNSIMLMDIFRNYLALKWSFTTKRELKTSGASFEKALEFSKNNFSSEKMISFIDFIDKVYLHSKEIFFPCFFDSRMPIAENYPGDSNSSFFVPQRDTLGIAAIASLPLFKGEWPPKKILISHQIRDFEQTDKSKQALSVLNFPDIDLSLLLDELIQHPAYFYEPQYQQLLWLRLFSVGHLTDSIQRNPHILTKYFHFATKMLSTFQENSREEADKAIATSIVQATQLKQFVNKLSYPDIQERFNLEYTKYQKNIQDIASQCKTSSPHETVEYALGVSQLIPMIDSLKEALSTQNIIPPEIIQNYYKVQQNQETLNLVPFNIGLSHELAQLPTLMNAYCNKLFEKSDKKDFQNLVNQLTSSASLDQKLYLNQNGVYFQNAKKENCVLDLNTGVLSERVFKKIAYIPRNHKLYTLFSVEEVAEIQKAAQPSSLNNDYFESVYQGQTYHFSTQRNQQEKIWMTYNNLTYQYTQDTQSFGEEQLPIPLQIPPKHHWYSRDRVILSTDKKTHKSILTYDIRDGKCRQGNNTEIYVTVFGSLASRNGSKKNNRNEVLFLSILQKFCQLF